MYRIRGLLAFALVAMVAPAFAQEPYKQPPKVVLDIIDAPNTPSVSTGPLRSKILLIDRVGMPTIAEMSQPMLGLAGARINPRTFGPHVPGRAESAVIKDVATGREVRVQLPPNTLTQTSWSPDGKLIELNALTANGIELWIADATTGQTRRLTDRRINATISGCEWFDNTRLLCSFVPQGIGAPPVAPAAPTGPIVQETSGRTSPVRTYQDLLSNPHEEAQFRYYFNSQIALVDATSGAVTEIGKPGIFTSVDASPDKNYVLVTRLTGSLSYQVPMRSFPRVTEVWNLKGDVVHTVASYPLEDDRPSGFVTTLPRSANWRPTEPATLMWVEALDDGNPRKAAEKRDKVMMLRAPFNGAATEVARTDNRFGGIIWTEKNVAFISDVDFSKRWRRAFAFNPDQPSQAWRPMWDLSMQDAYKNPGTPVGRPGTENKVLQHGDYIYLSGPGASPQGDRPFLDRMNVKTLKTERLWQSTEKDYEAFIALVDDDATRIITRKESITEPPNYYMRDLKSGKVTALTNFPDPAPQLAGVTKQLVKYNRKDGVPLSATLYLRSEEHTSELQSQSNLVCRLLLEKKKKTPYEGAIGSAERPVRPAVAGPPVYAVARAAPRRPVAPHAARPTGQLTEQPRLGRLWTD